MFPQWSHYITKYNLLMSTDAIMLWHCDIILFTTCSLTGMCIQKMWGLHFIHATAVEYPSPCTILARLKITLGQSLVAGIYLQEKLVVVVRYLVLGNVSFVGIPLINQSAAAKMLWNCTFRCYNFIRQSLTSFPDFRLGTRNSWWSCFCMELPDTCLQFLCLKWKSFPVCQRWFHERYHLYILIQIGWEIKSCSQKCVSHWNEG